MSDEKIYRIILDNNDGEGNGGDDGGAEEKGRKPKPERSDDE